MALNTFPSLCPTDCNGTLNYPAIEADQDCTSYDINYSELTDLWIQPTGAGAPFSAWLTGVYTVTPEPTNIDNTVTDNSATKWIVGAGGVAVPEKTTEELPKRRDRISLRTYTVTFNIPNVSDEMRDFGRSLQCGDTSFNFWYANLTHVFGSATGIEPKSADCDFPLDEGRDGRERMVITLTFESKVDPERRTKPTF